MPKSALVKSRPKKNQAPDLHSDKETLEEASDIQRRTKDSIERIQQNAAATKEVGITTLEELETQRRTLERIQLEGDRTENNLKTAERLQNKLSRWSLAFNRKAARKTAEKARDHEEEMEQKKVERNQRLEPEQAPSVEEEVIITKHGKGKKEMRKSKKKKKDSETPARAKGPKSHQRLYSGDDSDLQKLDEEDQEINEGLDVIGSQLDEIMNMAEAMGSETKAHGRGLDDVTDQMTEMNHQQRVVNNRTGRFLSGKIRREYEKEGTNSATGFW